MFVRTAILVLKKDITIEVKSLEIVSTTLFFAVSCVLIFSFALVDDQGKAIDTAMVPAAVLWIAVAFAGVLGLGRAFERERYGDTIKALLLAPAPRPAVYVGKLLGIVLLLFSTELVLVPMIAFARDHVAHPALSDYDSSPDCGRAGDVSAAGGRPERSGGHDVARAPDVVRRGVHHAGVVDV